LVRRFRWQAACGVDFRRGVFAESSFFPVPPDIMLIPMSLARPERAWFFATICTVASVVVGVLGYFIGAVLYDTVGAWLIHLDGYGDNVEAFRTAYAQYGSLIILLKGLTPIPYKIVTITSGFAGFNLFLFVILSLITRGARFFVEAFLLNRYGARARGIIEKRLGLPSALRPLRMGTSFSHSACWKLTAVSK
jgi:membrane protein YqaA with SNARE-associated domain